MRWMALTDNRRYRDRLEHWIAKVQHYFDVVGDAFNTVTLIDFTKQKKTTHAEPTSPAVQMSPDPENTPRMVDEAIQVLDHIAFTLVGAFVAVYINNKNNEVK